MGNGLLQSVVLVPVLVAMLAARTRRLRPALSYLVALLAAFDAVYLVLLYYLGHRWL